MNSVMLWTVCRVDYVIEERLPCPTKIESSHILPTGDAMHCHGDDADSLRASCTTFGNDSMVYELRNTVATQAVVDAVGAGGTARLYLQGMHCHGNASGINTYCRFHDIVAAYTPEPERSSIDISRQVPYPSTYSDNHRRGYYDTHFTKKAPTTHPALIDNGRYFKGDRRLALRAVVITATVDESTTVPKYAGDDANQRRDWIVHQRRFMDAEYRHSTYGKLGFDENLSDVVEVDIGTWTAPSPPNGVVSCSAGVWSATIRAYDAIARDRSFSNIDAVVYYIPEGITDALKDCKNVGGLCVIGALRDNNPTGDKYTINRELFRWRYSCVTMRQAIQSSVAARANVMAHELGHYLGLHHAGGNEAARYTRPSRNAPISDYGDVGATMGNDHHRLNSFTAPARYFLGVLHDDAVAINPDGVTFIRALTLSAASDPGVYNALVIPCDTCQSRSVSNAAVGGELWFTYRGDEDTCAPLENSDQNTKMFDCHADYTAQQRRVHVHYRGASQAWSKTEQWYWLEEGEVWEGGEGGGNVAARVCSIDTEADIALVAVGATSTRVAAHCAAAATRRTHIHIRESYTESTNATRSTAEWTLFVDARLEYYRTLATCDVINRSLTTILQDATCDTSWGDAGLSLNCTAVPTLPVGNQLVDNISVCITHRVVTWNDSSTPDMSEPPPPASTDPHPTTETSMLATTVTLIVIVLLLGACIYCAYSSGLDIGYLVLAPLAGAS